MHTLRRFLPLGFLLGLFVFGTPHPAAAQCTGQDECCGNNICDPGERESCPEDCNVPVCGDLQCRFGETAESCPEDCQPAGPVCGNGDCETGEDIASCPADCGSEGPVCGNNSCEAGEDAQSCPVDCVGDPGPVCGDATCTPDVESCGNCLQDCPCAAGTTCSPNPAPGICVQPCGNGTCDPPETNASCPEDCTGSGGCDNDGVCDPLENADTCPSDCTAPNCDFTDLPPDLQICCGDGTCDGGENPNRCARDCPATCGDGLCSPTQGENSDTCSQDCCFSQVTCAAGCAAVPTFYISPSNGQVGAFEEVTFTALTDHVAAGSSINWDFGDGHHCEGICGLTATHRYERIGTFPARMTASENVCGETILSFPQYIVVGMPPVRDDAQAISTTIPTCVGVGQQAVTSVRFRNVGGTTWSSQFGQELRRLGGATIVPSSIMSLPPGVTVAPGQSYDFSVPIIALPDQIGDHTLSLQMGGISGLFGDVSTSLVSIRNSCEGAQPKTGDYTCTVRINTQEGTPVSNVRVRLAAFSMNDAGEEDMLVADPGVTGNDGVAYLAIDHPGPNGGTPVDLIACSAFEIDTIESPTVLLGDADDVPVPQHLDLALTGRTTFAQRINLPGLKNDIVASARLYQSGAYDRPVVIPAPFNATEQDEPYTDESLYGLFKEFIRGANSIDLDVWLMRTTTGQNIHEQSGEFAQLIDFAARRLGPDGKVTVAGYSLGGVNSRLTTARYQADSDWRARLGVQRQELPVNLVAFGDAPLTGANIPFNLQTAIWTQLSPNGRPFPYNQLPQAMAKSNLNSCGAQQLLRKSVPSVGANFDRFWSLGDPVRFPNVGNPGGVCDRVSGFECVCDAGPALFSVNGDGWAHDVRVVAFSDGSPGPQGCFGVVDGKNLDLDGRDRNVCRDASEVFGVARPIFPQLGQPMFRVQLPFAADEDIFPTADDLGSGSRIAIIAKTECQEVAPFSVCGGVKKQYFSPTFIPFDSALPNGPFAQTWHLEGYQGVHGNSPDANTRILLGEINAAFNQPSGQRASFNRGVVGAAGQTVDVSFPSVLAPGDVTVVTNPQGPNLPSGLVMGEDQGFYDISSTITTQPTRNDPIEVCINYGSTRFMDESRLVLYHFDGVNWADVTSFRDSEANRICGVTTSLSPFAVLEPTNHPPVAPQYPLTYVEATGPSGGAASLKASGFSDVDRERLLFGWTDDRGLSYEGPLLQTILGIGSHTLVVTARDPRGASASTSREVVVRDTTAPSVSLSVSSAGGTLVLMAQASDAVGVARVRFEMDGLSLGEVVADPYSLTYALAGVSDGPHSVVATATDTSGNTALSAPVTVLVDNTPPVLSAQANPSSIWPPNKKLVPVVVTITLHDAIDAAPTVILEAVACNDGCSASADIVGAAVGSDDRSVSLRAYRSGSGSGRTYSLTYKATDASGNIVRKVVQVMVPHDQH